MGNKVLRRPASVKRTLTSRSFDVAIKISVDLIVIEQLAGSIWLFKVRSAVEVRPHQDMSLHTNKRLREAHSAISLEMHDVKF